jgi:hypothetical protein
MRILLNFNGTIGDMIKKLYSDFKRTIRTGKVLLLQDRSSNGCASASQEVVPIGPRRLHSKIEPTFGSIYLTLLSIIQSVALGLLAVEFNNATNAAVGQSLSRWILIFVSFVILVLVWHSYLDGLLSVYWHPTIVDSLLPFGIGMCECILVTSTADPPKWFLCCAFLSILGALVNLNSLISTRTAFFESTHAKRSARSRSRSVVASRLLLGFFILPMMSYISRSFPGLTLILAMTCLALVLYMLWVQREPIKWPLRY